MTNRRVLLFRRTMRRFVIEDRLEGRDRHRVEWFFHLTPRSRPADAATPAQSFSAGEVDFSIEPILLPEGTRAVLEEGMHSPGYGRLERSTVLRYDWSGKLPVIGRFAIAASRRGPGRSTES